MKIRLTLLPVPETRIGDLTMYIPSRGLLTRTTSSPFDSSTSSSWLLTVMYNIDDSSETICVTVLAAVKRCAPYSTKRSKRVGLNIRHQLRLQCKYTQPRLNMYYD
ncbi:hypothetical protein M9H77_08067 [Catharanthus roseus]|uniref:Uncharacterized protein n=1 Tax=Catharanthus roseus TaxID=4058 RepID=A0ACC0BWZ0_CATRO|nr:hypothetical protein M9H77_08067 [Catharanthus roseus]